MGFGRELPLLLALGFVVLGPKRMQANSLIERTVERGLLRMAKALNLGVLTWSSLASGVLTELPTVFQPSCCGIWVSGTSSNQSVNQPH
jgi:hypothetical protein